MSGGEDEARRYVIAVVGTTIEKTRLADLRSSKRDLVQRRDALAKQKVGSVHLNVSGTLFKVPHEDARRSILREMEALDQEIDRVDSLAERHARDMQRAPQWATSIMVPTVLQGKERVN